MRSKQLNRRFEVAISVRSSSGPPNAPRDSKHVREPLSASNHLRGHKRGE